jgi:hypothetical protein
MFTPVRQVAIQRPQGDSLIVGARSLVVPPYLSRLKISDREYIVSPPIDFVGANVSPHVGELS